MTPWYYSPYPFDEEKEINELYVCEYCLKYIRLAKCITWHRVGTFPLFVPIESEKTLISFFG